MTALTNMSPSFLIMIADSWLHITATTAQVDIAARSDAPKSYGRTAPASCNETLGLGNCFKVKAAATSQSFYVNASEYFLTITGQSTVNTIATANMGSDRFSYIAPTNVSADTDYTASTIAMRSVCDFVGERCSNTPAGNLTCGAYLIDGNIFNGTVVYSYEGDSNPLSVSYFSDVLWEHLLDGNSTVPFTTAIVGSPTVSAQAQAIDDYVYPYGMGSNAYYVLGCETEFLNMTYTYIQGSVVAANVSRIQASILTEVMMSTITELDPLVQQTLSIAAQKVFYSPSVEEAINAWRDAFHVATLSPITSVSLPVMNLEEQVRTTVTAACLVKYPLWTLIVLLITVTLVGLFFSVYTLLQGQLRAAFKRQSLLSIGGLVISLFERSERTALKTELIESKFEEATGSGQSGRIILAQNSTTGAWQLYQLEPFGFLSSADAVGAGFVPASIDQLAPAERKQASENLTQFGQ
jgi:hypothetical protein